MRPWRNLLLLTVMAALCFGGSFTCTTTHDGDDDNFNGNVTINTRPQ